MKITGIRARSLFASLAAPMRSRGDVGYAEFFHTGSEFQRITVVEILTDSEHRGVTLLPGDATEWLEEVAEPTLSGLDAAAIRHGRARIGAAQARASRNPAVAPRSYLNRLEFGLWDLAAKGAGLPLFRLLGGMDPDVRVYAGGGSLCWNPLHSLLSETESLLERGFRALKIKIGHGPEEDAEIVRAIRGVCGPDVRIMVDANRAYDLVGALRLSETLAAEGIDWFEEPFGYDCPEDWRTLRRASPVLLAGGEGFGRIAEASRAVSEEMLDVLQCDAGGFGLEALLATASVAHEGGVSLTPHSCNSVIGFLVGCHLQSALPNSQRQEFETFDNPFVHSIFNEGLSVTGGSVRLTEAPGLGVTLNEELIQRHLVS